MTREAEYPVRTGVRKGVDVSVRRGHQKTIVPVLIVLALLAVSCGRENVESETVDRRVLVLGIDGLEWDVMAPLVEEGRLPTFDRLMREGTWGELVSLDILESPVIWTSIATGKVPEKHGISGFAKRSSGGTDVPMTSNVRRVDAVWDILGDRGWSVGVIGWLATWPATPVNGYMVSSHFLYGRGAEDAFPEDVTYPPELVGSLTPLLLEPEDIPDGSAGAFVRGELEDEAARQRLEGLKRLLADDETTRQLAADLGRDMPTDFLAVYFRGIDGASHFYWVDMLPDTGPTMPADEAETFGDAIPLYYEYIDGVLAEMLRLADDETTVIVTSDHGHSGPKLRGEDDYEWGIAMHDPTGFVCFWGKDVAEGRKLDEPSVLDLTPTILAFCGLPVAEDMDGRVLEQAIDDDFLAAHPVETTPTYETGERGGDEEPIESPVDEEIRERLRSLGYLD